MEFKLTKWEGYYVSGDLSDWLNDEDLMVLSILDPLSSKLPEIMTKIGNLQTKCTKMQDSSAHICIRNVKSCTELQVELKLR